MTIRQEMLQAARRAAQAPGDRRRLIERFILGRLNADGGFPGRSTASDLYYTLFALECLSALGCPLPVQVKHYLATFGCGEGLDLVHLACLVRCRSALGEWREERDRQAALGRLAAFRSSDGGFGPLPGQERGHVYSCFLAVGACQDLAAAVENPEGVARCVESCRLPDGGYANSSAAPPGTTPVTAAAATVLRHLGRPARAETSAWLLSLCRPEGGFPTAPVAPAADLLSTATALHALAGMGADLDAIRRPCAQFVNRLWSPRGGFLGHAFDEQPDCEYTFYGLLALGNLWGGTVSPSFG